MGYETRIHVVDKYNFNTGIPHGELLAMINLCKCGDGPVGKLVAKHTKHAPNNPYKGKPPFALYDFEPERQQEAVELLRFLADQNLPNCALSPKEVAKLANHIEDGDVITDKYGDYLGVIPIDDFITALEEEKAASELHGEVPDRRYTWALDLLKSIRKSYADRGLYGADSLFVITYGY